MKPVLKKAIPVVSGCLLAVLFVLVRGLTAGADLGLRTAVNAALLLAALAVLGRFFPCGWKLSPKDLLFAVSFAAAFALAELLFMRVPHEGTVSLLLVVNTVCISPVLEEALYRGILPGLLGKSMESRAAALLSLLLFAAGHSGPGQMAAALVFGATCFFLLKKTGTLAAPVLFHALVNLAGCWI